MWETDQGLAFVRHADMLSELTRIAKGRHIYAPIAGETHRR